MYPNHDTDVYGWAVHTAQLLREKKMDEIDIEGIIEEIDALGRSEKHELINRLSLILSHLLKWQFQPTLRSHSWIYTIKEQRKQVSYHLEDNPSLNSKLEEAMIKAYRLAIDKAARDTSLPAHTFPSQCPYTFDQMMDDDFYPD